MSELKISTPKAPETITVDSEKVYCDGTDGSPSDSGPLGHPRVYLTMGRQGFVDCPYCDRHFVLSSNARAAAH